MLPAPEPKLKTMKKLPIYAATALLASILGAGCASSGGSTAITPEEKAAMSAPPKPLSEAERREMEAKQAQMQPPRSAPTTR